MWAGHEPARGKQNTARTLKKTRFCYFVNSSSEEKLKSTLSTFLYHLVPIRERFAGEWTMRAIVRSIDETALRS